MQGSALSLSVYDPHIRLHMTVKGVNYTNNLVNANLLSNAIFASVHIYFQINTADTCSITIIDCNFINNGFDNASPVSEASYSSYGVLLISATNAVISIRNTSIANNTGAAILVKPSTRADRHLNLLLESSIVANNTIYVSDYYVNGAVQINYIC